MLGSLAISLGSTAATGRYTKLLISWIAVHLGPEPWRQHGEENARKDANERGDDNCQEAVKSEQVSWYMVV